MLLLFPIGHENQIVQRLPYVTIVIIALNVLFFLGTRHTQSRIENQYTEKIEQIAEFYSRHSDLNLDEIMQEEDHELKALLLELKQRYGNGWPIQESTAKDKEGFRELINEIREIKYGLPSYKYGLIPANPKLFNYLSSIFMHGGFFHLLFNMIFLWTFGAYLETLVGWKRFILYYLAGGYSGREIRELLGLVTDKEQ